MANSRSVLWKWVVFLLCAVIFGLAPVRQALDSVKKYYSAPAKAEWNAANAWLLSAECMKKTGAWLSVCEEKELYPIANYALADDPGHALLLGIKARWQNRAISLLDINTLNISINFVGLMMIYILLIAAGSYVAALLMLAAGPSIFYYLWVPSPHPAITGAVCFALLFPLTVLLLNRKLISVLTGRILLAVSLPLLGMAALLREPVGMMGVVAGIGVLIFDWLAVHRKKKLLSTVVLATMVILAGQAPRFVLMLRDSIFPVHGTSQIQTHGMSHTLYVGLGAVDNKFGIRWDDRDAMAAAQSAEPGVSYTSEKYFQLLWKLYWQRVQQDPIEVMRIYAKKACEILIQSFPKPGIPLVVLLMGTVAVWRLATRRYLWSRLDYRACPVMLSVCCLFIGFFVLQGTVAHPDRQYSYPVNLFVFMIISVLLELLLRSFWKSQHDRRTDEAIELSTELSPEPGRRITVVTDNTTAYSFSPLTKTE